MANKTAKKKRILEFDRDACISCAGCVGTCPDLALDMFETDLQVFFDKCTVCGICARICPVGALTIRSAQASETPKPQETKGT